MQRFEPWWRAGRKGGEIAQAGKPEAVSTPDQGTRFCSLRGSGQIKRHIEATAAATPASDRQELPEQLVVPRETFRPRPGNSAISAAGICPSSPSDAFRAERFSRQVHELRKRESAREQQRYRSTRRVLRHAVPRSKVVDRELACDLTDEAAFFPTASAHTTAKSASMVAMTTPEGPRRCLPSSRRRADTTAQLCTRSGTMTPSNQKVVE